MEATDQKNIEGASSALAADVAEVIKLVKAYKTGGKEALMAELPEVIKDVKATIPAVQAALPTIKAGYKTTEFWLVAAVVLGNGILFAVTGKSIPLDVNVVLALVSSVYAMFRSGVKNSAATPAT